jgi:hypothetical protein
MLTGWLMALALAALGAGVVCGARWPRWWLAFTLSGGPAGGVVMRVSLVVRRLQHGRLQSYVLYVLAGMLAVGVFVMFASLT